MSSRPNYTLKVRFQMNSCGFMHFGANLPHPRDLSQPKPSWEGHKECNLS